MWENEFVSEKAKQEFDELPPKLRNLEFQINEKYHHECIKFLA